jgi:3-oxoacyl-[acyl-carrier-protein] synthase II
MVYGISVKDARRIEKFIQYALAGARQAVTDAGIDFEKEDRDRIGVLRVDRIGSLRIIEEEHKVLFAKRPFPYQPFPDPQPYRE